MTNQGESLAEGPLLRAPCPPADVQSAKPEELYEWIEGLFPNGRFMDIFARMTSLRCAQGCLGVVEPCARMDTPWSQCDTVTDRSGGRVGWRIGILATTFKCIMQAYMLFKSLDGFGQT